MLILAILTVQKTVWQRMRAKIIGTESGFPLAIISNAPMTGMEAKENLFAQRSQESERKVEGVVMTSALPVSRQKQKKSRAGGAGLAEQAQGEPTNRHDIWKGESIDAHRSTNSMDRLRLTEDVEKRMCEHNRFSSDAYLGHGLAQLVRHSPVGQVP